MPYLKIGLLILPIVSFAIPIFITIFLKEKPVVGCPSRRIQFYIEKLTEIFKSNSKNCDRSVYGVPCCSGLVRATRRPSKLPEKTFPEKVKIGIHEISNRKGERSFIPVPRHARINTIIIEKETRETVKGIRDHFYWRLLTEQLWVSRNWNQGKNRGSREHLFCSTEKDMI